MSAAPRMGLILNIRSDIPETKSLYVTLACILLESVSQCQTPLQTITRVSKKSILIKTIILSESEKRKDLK